MIKQSSLTFKDLTENLAYTEVKWNGKTIWKDNPDDNGESLDAMHDMQAKYNNKIVYEMNIKIVMHHHCVLDIKGEE